MTRDDRAAGDALASAATLVEAFRERVRRSASRTWLTLYDRDRVSATRTFGELGEGAAAWAAALAGAGVGLGDRVVLVLPTSPAFYEAYWGVLLAGAVPVPAYPPTRVGQLDDYVRDLGVRLESCGARALVTDRRIRPLLHGAGPGLPRVVPQDVRPAAAPPRPPPSPVDLALLQYTSGSTGRQKGVMLTHANLLANLRAIGGVLAFRPEEDVAVSWLPLYHDMGLIGLMLGTFYFGVPLVALSPVDFLRRPVRWLRALSDHRASHTAGPNFAYSLLSRKARDGDLEGIDLSACRLALCGAEPVYPETVEGFLRRFRPCGFRAEAFFPAYGLAEHTLAATFSEAGAAPRTVTVDLRTLEEEGRVVERAPGKGAKTLVSVGVPLAGVELRVAGSADQALGEGWTGEVQLRGPSVMRGYYGAPEATAEVLRGGWLHTGDLGFLLGGRLYVSGRKKDLVIRAGRNYFAEDLEAAAAATPGVRPGGVAAFSTESPQRGTEEVVLVVEARPGAGEGLGDAVRRRVSEATGCRPDRVVVVPPRTLPKTSSGKIQRFRVRARYREGELEGPARGGRGAALWAYLRAWTRDRLGRGRR